MAVKINRSVMNHAHRVISGRLDRVKRSSQLGKALVEYGIGTPLTGDVALTATDRQALRSLFCQLGGVDLSEPVPSGSTFDMAMAGVTDEKIGQHRSLETRLLCTALPGPVWLHDVAHPATAQVEYRVDEKAIDPSRYDAVLRVENFESFLRIHLIRLPRVYPNALVLYRGDGQDMRVVQSVLQRFSRLNKPVIALHDPDPAGLGMIYDSGWSHAAVPAQSWMDAQGYGNIERAGRQMAQRPDLKTKILHDARITAPFKQYASWLLDGRAMTEETLLSQGIELRIIPVRQAEAGTLDTDENAECCHEIKP